MFGYLPGPYSESWLRSWYIFGYSAAKLEIQPAAVRFRQGCPQPLPPTLGRVFRNIVIQNSVILFLLIHAFFSDHPVVDQCSPMFATCLPMFATHGCQLPKPGSTPVEDRQIQIRIYFNVTHHINAVWHAIRHDTSSFQNSTPDLIGSFRS